jgi:hypothetical protein
MSELIHNLLVILLPTCASFGPFFLVFGILGRTSKSSEANLKLANAYLFAGGAMITLVLWSTVIHINAPR